MSDNKNIKVAEGLFLASKSTPQRRSMAYVYCNLLYFFGNTGGFLRKDGLKLIQAENPNLSQHLYNTYLDMMLRNGYLRSNSKGYIYITSYKTLFPAQGKDKKVRRILVDTKYILGAKGDFFNFCAYMTMVDAKRAMRRSKVQKNVDRFTVLTKDAGAVYINEKNRRCTLTKEATSSQAMHIPKNTIAKIAGVSPATASRIRKRASKTGLLALVSVLLPYTYEAHQYEGLARDFMTHYVNTLSNRNADIRTLDINAHFGYFRGMIANPKVGLNRIVQFGKAAYIQCPSLIVFDPTVLTCAIK